MLSELKSPEAFPSPFICHVRTQERQEEEEGRGREGEWMVETLFQFGNALREEGNAKKGIRRPIVEYCVRERAGRKGVSERA